MPAPHILTAGPPVVKVIVPRSNNETVRIRSMNACFHLNLLRGIRLHPKPNLRRRHPLRSLFFAGLVLFHSGCTTLSTTHPIGSQRIAILKREVSNLGNSVDQADADKLAEAA